MGWLFELAGTVITVLSPSLHENGILNVYYPDAMLMFVVIPFVHLTNDEETKTIIAEENWYQGLRYMLGIRKNKKPYNKAQIPLL